MRVLNAPMRFLYHRAPGMLTIIPLMVLWEIIGQLGWIFVLPPLTEVIAAGWELLASGRVAAEAGGTLIALLTGFGISLVGGLALGLVMGRFSLAERVFGVYVDVLMSAPVSAIVPILVLVLGTGRETIVAAVILFCFFVITINTYAGVKDVDDNLVEMARSFGVPEHLAMRRVYLPGALPLMLTGVRMGIGRAFNGVIFGEMLISVVGLGGLLITFGGRFMFDYLDALIILIVGVAVVAMLLFEKLECRLLGNKYGLASQ